MNNMLTCRAPEVERFLEALGLKGLPVLRLQVVFDPQAIVCATAEIAASSDSLDELSGWSWVATEGRDADCVAELNRRFNTLELRVREQYRRLGLQIEQQYAALQRKASMRQHGTVLLINK
jgi:hypothetical protein